MKAKKILSLLLAASMLSVPVVSTSAEDAEESTIVFKGFDANDLTINDYGNGFVDPPAGLDYGTSQDPIYGNARLYKVENVFGLEEGEYGIEMVAREQRRDQPFYQLRPGDDNIDLEHDFYIQQNIYVGDLKEADYFRIGGEFNDGTKRNTNQYFWFAGNGTLQTSARADRVRGIGAYEKGNWYNITIAYTASDKTFRMYTDGKQFNITTWGANYNWTVADEIRNFAYGIRIQQTDSDFGGKPAWLISKNIEMIKDTYVPGNSSTAVESSVYTIANSGIVHRGNALASEAASSVSKIAGGTTVEAFLNNITIPSGAEKSVVKINEDDNKTSVVENSKAVTSDMKLLVKAADDSMKLYTLDVSTEASLLPEISLKSDTPSRYSLNADTKTFMVPDTTAEILKGYIEAGEGTSFKITNNDKTIERTGTDPITETMKVVAVKGDVEVEYGIAIKNIIPLNTSDYLDKTTDGTTLLTGTKDGTWDPTNTRLPGFGTIWSGGSSVSKGSLTIEKTTLESGTSAYNFTTTEADAVANITTGTGGTTNTKYASGIKTIFNYKLKLQENSQVSFSTTQAKDANGGGTTVEGKGTDGTNLMRFGLQFVDGSIKMIRKENAGVFKTIGTYTNDTEYDVAIVCKTPDGTAGDLIIEGIYINQEKIFPVETKDKAADGCYHITWTGTLFSLARSVNFSTVGSVILGGIKVCMTDDYNPNKAQYVDEDVSTTPDRVTDFGVELDSSLTSDSLNRVYGWSGMTVAEIKNKVDSNANTAIKVLNVSGNNEIKDTAALENNMIIKIYDVNYPDNAVYYVLALTNDWGTWEANVEETEDGNIIKLSRSINIYDKINSTKVTAVFAAYLNGKLVDVDIDADTIEKTGGYDLSASVKKIDGATYKAMLWNTDTQKPVEEFELIVK